MKIKKIGVVGLGYVGTAIYDFFKDHYEVIFFDPEKENSSSKEEINTCDLGVVCVPTPIAEDKSCDLSLVKETVNWLETPLILMKSTVEPGTTDKLREETGKRIVFSPEYSGESTYWSPYLFDSDIKEEPWYTFGGDPEDTTILVNTYMKVVGPTKTYQQTDAKAAEVAKYVENCFYATKVLFCYEIAEICKRTGVDYNEMRELWLLDPRVNRMHTAVFTENNRPFGGKCFPKDINALVRFAQKNGYEAKFLEEVIKSNERVGNIRGRNES